MNLLLRTPAQPTTVHCRIAARAVLCASAETIAQWRRQLIGHGAHKLPASFLKYAEDQTVVALTAVFTAIEEQGWRERPFADWGALAAPSFFGRVGNAQAFQRYRDEGAWGISPHLIPQQSLHGMSGAVSQALGLHGPNFGISGGANPGLEAFFIAAAMASAGGLPGLWLVMTGYETEWIPAPDRAVPAPLCHGIALALTPAESGARWPFPRSSVGAWEGEPPAEPGLPGSARASPSHSAYLAAPIWMKRPNRRQRLTIGQVEPGGAPIELCPDFELAAFAEELPGHSTGKWRLSGSHWLELAAEVQR